MDSVSKRIMNEACNFTKRQTELGNFICRNMYDVSSMNAPQIARAAGVSEATVTRFVRALRYDSFASFMRALKEETGKKLARNPFRQEKYGDKSISVFDRVFELEKSLLDETIRIIDYDTFGRCVEKIAGADRVLIIGGPNHDFLARYFRRSLSMMCQHVETSAYMDVAFYSSLQSLSRDKSVAVVFCYPRYPRETMRMLRALKERGIPVIGITDSELSPVMPYVDYPLITPQKYLIFVDPNAPVVAMIHALLISVYQRDTERIKERLHLYEQDIIKSDMYEFKDYNFTEML